MCIYIYLVFCEIKFISEKGVSSLGGARTSQFLSGNDPDIPRASREAQQQVVDNEGY